MRSICFAWVILITMTKSDIVKNRLSNLQISKSTCQTPEQIVSLLGAIQSQDYSGASWAVGLRLKGAHHSQIDRAFDAGKILRTHALRPTWHFVSPEDIRWMIELNAPQVKKIMNYYNKKLELNDRLFAKSNTLIAGFLKGRNFQTRTEIGKLLNRNGIQATGQRLGHIVGWAELDGIICSGPRRGKQFTYALVSEVAPDAKSIPREKSISKLARIFFTTRGPATVRDFSKWSGLNMADSRQGLDEIKTELELLVIGENRYYFSRATRKNTPAPPLALLLPNYDEYISSYSDYSVISEPGQRKNLDQIGNAAFWNHVIIRGMVAGSWRRIFKPKEVEIELALQMEITPEEKKAVEKEADKFSEFWGLKVKLL